MIIIKTASVLEKEAKKKDYKEKYNPWAVCHSKIDSKEEPAKYERCVKDVKKKDRHKKSEINGTLKKESLFFPFLFFEPELNELIRNNKNILSDNVKNIIMGNLNINNPVKLIFFKNGKVLYSENFLNSKSIPSRIGEFLKIYKNDINNIYIDIEKVNKGE